MHNSLFPKKFKDVNGVPYKVYYIKYTNHKGEIAHKSTGCRNKADATIVFKQFNPKKPVGIDMSTLKEEALNYSRNLSKEHHRQYNALWERLMRYVGNKPLSQVTYSTLQNYINERKNTLSARGKSYSPCSINLEISILKKSFEIALDNYWMEGNPARKIKKLQPPKTVPEFIKQDAHTLLEALKSHPDIRYYQATLIAFNTGMRRGEVCRLKWEQVDLINSEIHLRNKINKKPEYCVINETVGKVLSEVEKRIDGYVFNLNENYTGKLIKKYIKKLNLNPALRFHSTRHTFITEAVNSFGIHIAQDLARHSNISMTNKYYHSKKQIVKEAGKQVVI